MHTVHIHAFRQNTHTHNKNKHLKKQCHQGDRFGSSCEDLVRESLMEGPAVSPNHAVSLVFLVQGLSVTWNLEAPSSSGSRTFTPPVLPYNFSKALAYLFFFSIQCSFWLHDALGTRKKAKGTLGLWDQLFSGVKWSTRCCPFSEMHGTHFSDPWCSPSGLWTPPHFWGRSTIRQAHRVTLCRLRRGDLNSLTLRSLFQTQSALLGSMLLLDTWFRQWAGSGDPLLASLLYGATVLHCLMVRVLKVLCNIFGSVPTLFCPGWEQNYLLGSRKV